MVPFHHHAYNNSQTTDVHLIQSHWWKEWFFNKKAELTWSVEVLLLRLLIIQHLYEEYNYSLRWCPSFMYEGGIRLVHIKQFEWTELQNVGRSYWTDIGNVKQIFSSVWIKFATLHKNHYLDQSPLQVFISRNPAAAHLDRFVSFICYIVGGWDTLVFIFAKGWFSVVDANYF